MKDNKQLFESTWREGFEFFERVYCPIMGRSIKKKIDLPFEWYEQSSNGLYESILDPSIKLEKKQGRSRDGRGHYGYTSPMYRNIRENHWKTGYNENPCVWYLDIETRSGRSYKNLGIGNMKIRNTDTNKETVLPVEEIQQIFYDIGENKFQYFDEKQNKWDALSNSFFMQRNKGFPSPKEANERVSVIQIFDSKINEVIMIALKEWKHKESYEHLMEYPVKYIVAKNEIDLFNIYNKIFERLNPLVIYAWNGNGFDFPYLFNRMKRIGIDTNSLSNYGEVKLNYNGFEGRIDYSLESPGHYYIDMIDAYKLYIKTPRASYALDYIAEVELGENKVNHSEYSQFDHFYLGIYNIPDNPTEEQKNSKIYQTAIKEGLSEEVRELGHSEFCWYSYKDPLLIKKIDDKLNFTALMINSSQRMGVKLSDSFGTVRPWSQYIANNALLDNKVLPGTIDNPDPNVVGGYVMDPARGKKKWVLSADVNSMYPLLGMTAFNMSPETFIDTSDMPADLRDLVLSYFNSQDEGPALDYDNVIWDKLIELLNKYNFSMGVNGVVFTKEREGLIPSLVLGIYNSRKATRAIENQYRDRKMLIEKIIYCNKNNEEYKCPEEFENLSIKELSALMKDASEKERQYNTEQTGLKLIINSLYGALANKWFPLFNEKMAQAITGNGRFFIRLLGKNIERRLQQMHKLENDTYMIYSDTDSVYYHIEPFVNMFIEKNPDSSIIEQTDFADNFEKKVIAPIIQETIDELSTKLNAFNKDVIGASREIIADSAVFVQKKKYLARVRDDEGFRFPEHSPNIKVMGLDLIKSSTPTWSKTKLAESIEHILDKDEEDLRNWLQETKVQYLDTDVIDIVTHGGVNSLEYVLGEKGVPFGSRAALVHNKYIEENDLTDVYAPIEAGDKTMRAFLKLPNKFHSNVVAFTNDSFVKEFEHCIDYDTMFEKGFINALENMTNSLGYNLRKETESLNDW